MKKRRTLIIALLLIAAIALGVGYAATSGNVKVTGEVYNKPHDLELVFVESGCSLTSAHIDGSNLADPSVTQSEVIVNDGDISAIFNVKGISHTGDSVTATFTVRNNNKYDVKLKSIEAAVVGDAAASFFTPTANWGDGYAAGDILVGETGTATFTVTVTMNKITAEALDGDFVVTVYAESAS